MRRFFRNMILAAAAVFAMACSKNEAQTKTDGALPVSMYNLSGIWSLVEWNGQALAEGTFAYLSLDSQGTFKTYTNLEATSSVVTRESGEFEIDTTNDTLWGQYDYRDYQKWSQRYLVSELTAQRMVWIGAEDESQVRVYERLDKLPEGIEE